MPLARSNTGRSQSRSPLPFSTAPRQFLPPSHYAAAAGISYDDNKHAAFKKGDPKDAYARACMSAYPYEADSASELSFEFKPREDKPPIPSKSIRRSRRESLLNDLPQLEAHLLPSLRDTIDRMTKSPAQTESSSTSHLSIPRPSGASRSSRSLSPAYTSREPTVPKSTTPEPSAQGPAVLNSRTNLPAKPPPRHSLRPPAPKIHAQLVGDDSTPGSARSILKKFPKRGSTPSPIPDSGVNRRSAVSTNSKQPFPPTRSRSRTDPGTTPTVAFVPPNDEAINSQSTPRSQPSGIPRLRTAADTYWPTDESDADNRYEPRGRDRRPSSTVLAGAHSGSESEADRRKVDVDLRNSNKRVGLGLALNPEKKRSKAGTSYQVAQPSRSGVPPPRSTHVIQKDPHPTRPRSSTFDVPSEHKQRREALLDIVSRLNLDNDPGGESDYNGEDGVAITLSPDILEEEETQHQGHRAPEGNSDNEQDRHEADSAPYSHVSKSRPRSMSHTPTPTFLLSPNPDNHYSSSSHSSTSPHNKHHLGPPPTSNPRVKTPSHRESSRSPVVPQIDTNAIPAALRRHSVYHRAAGPGIQAPPANKVSNSSEDKDKKTSDQRNSGASASASVSKARRETSQQRRESTVSINVVANAEVEARPYAAAARERERRAYGIPPFDSFETNQDQDGDDRQQPRLPHAESDLSSVSSMYWGDDSDSELSPAAETLFRKLVQGRGEKKGQQPSAIRSSIVPRESSPSPPTTQKADVRWQAQNATPRHEERRSRSRATTPPPVPMLPSNDFAAVDTESRRQDLIVEIHQAEEVFVKRLQVFVQLFILPLRVQDNKEWIAGVPTEVARLFDWLEDIVVLHTQILASLNAIRDAQFPTVERFADSIRTFIPRLEVYQPYLVNLEHVITLVERLIEEEDNDFGEFVRLQEAVSECDGWNFQSFLIEPVTLLAKFPTLFSKLLGMTPKSHRDYLPTLALVRSTEMFIRVMTEVKLREDEHDMIQEYLVRIQGLPSSSTMASRERRLLHQGLLHLLDVEANDSSVTAGTSRLFRYFPPDANTAVTDRGGTFISAIHRWNTTGRGRSGSASSTSSNGVSLSSLKASSSAASSTFFSSFKLALPQGRLKPLSTKRPSSPTPAPRGNNLDLYSTPPHGTPIQVFVFTDLLLLAALAPGPESCDEWTLLNHIGTTRILDVQPPQETDLHGHDSSMNPSGITLEVLSVPAHKLNHIPNHDLNDSSVFLLRLEIPSLGTDDNNSDDSANTAKHQWETALRQCQQFTLCSLSTPTMNHDPQLDAAYDKHQAVYSLLASGLPLPKSPSAQIADIQNGLTDNAMTQEREERGWWSLRFQQVFRELQRQDMVLAAVVGL